MSAYSDLSKKELAEAVRQTREAIQKGIDLLSFVARNHTTLGLQQVAEATPRTMHALESDLRQLEDELDKKHKE